MTIYSRWRPDGGYDYFEAGDFAALGNDLHNPVMPAETKLGVPSVEVGHRLPTFARHVGEGDKAVGILAPMDTSNLASVSFVAPRSAIVYGLIGGFLVAMVWYGTEKLRGRS
jgi:hypothetical protein